MVRNRRRSGGGYFAPASGNPADYARIYPESGNLNGEQAVTSFDPFAARKVLISEYLWLPLQTTMLQ